MGQPSDSKFTKGAVVRQIKMFNLFFSDTETQIASKFDKQSIYLNIISIVIISLPMFLCIKGDILGNTRLSLLRLWLSDQHVAGASCQVSLA